MKKKVLFVCTGNSCRSVMAEGIFKHLMAGKENQFTAASAGINALDDYPASEETVRVMQENGIDVSGHRSRRLTAAMVRTSDKIFVMETFHKDAILRSWPEAMEKVRLLSEFAVNEKQRSREIDIPDPIRMPDDFYKNVFRTIRGCVTRMAKQMEDV